MKYIKTFREGMHISGIYLCKNRQIQLTKGGKEYISVVLQDKSGTVDGKIWDPGNPGIRDFDAHDYIDIEADVTLFNNVNQLNIKCVRKAEEGEYIPADYLPVSEYNLGDMYDQLLAYVASVKNKHLNALLRAFFEDDSEFVAKLKFSSAAKSVHHSYVGGLLEHTVHVLNMCDFMSKEYKYLNHDLLISAALLHDVAKTIEITPYPENDYSDEGQLIGHIVLACEMIDDKLREMPDFPSRLAAELKHCILAHHGEYEYGSPKKPALAEALALHFADNTDAKLQIMKEALANAADDSASWLGYNKLIDSNIRRTSIK